MTPTTAERRNCSCPCHVLGNAAITPSIPEVLPEIIDECERVTLAASNTISNGIRIGLLEPDEYPHWIEFDFTDQQAFDIGSALVRWSGIKGGDLNESEQP